MSYSYVDQSPGYTELTVQQAKKELSKLAAEFSSEADLANLFRENPLTPHHCRVRQYFLGLDRNQQAALREFYDRMAPRQSCF